ncbi:DUF4333 domain-containing protein [Streptomyces sp. NPDC057900]|uniref:DUF4333 domain-containing protein n=1 Tax=Streptomyces sp. NPDC057900 TaxID=3346274 RepID=UPI0036F0436E
MRQSGRSRTAVRIAAGALAVLCAAGCSASVGSTKAVSKKEVAKQAKAGLAKEVGREPDDVTCEHDLKAKVGETVRCTLTADGKKQGMTVTAKSVDGDNVHMAFKVDDAPDGGGGSGGGAKAVDKAEVARQGKAALTAQVGQEPDTFTCPEDLPARVNAVVRCQLGADGKQYGVTATATSVVDGRVKMDFKVDDAPSG